MKKFMAVILIISLSLGFLATSIENNAYDRDYYEKAFIEYGVIGRTDKEIEELMPIADNLILYLKHKGEEELLEPYFNEREIAHMIDVQGLFDLCRNVKYISIVISILIMGYLIFKKEYLFMTRTLSLGFFVDYILIGIIGILAYTDFTKYFTIFHKIFFDNDLWILNPKTDLMIQMLPEPFFIGMAINILKFFVISLIIVQVFAFISNRLLNKKLKIDGKL